MDVRLSDEQQMLVDTAARIAVDNGLASVEDLGSIEDHAAAHWAVLADAGLLALRVPESAGGMGASAVEVCLVGAELSKALTPAPFVIQGAVVPALLGAAGAADLLEAVAYGTRRIGVAMTPDLQWIAQPNSDAVLVGIDGADAVLSMTADGAVHLHPIADASRADGLDLTQGALQASLEGGDRLGAVAPDEQLRVEALALTALAADLVGLMQAALDETVIYLRDRQQFGKPIGSFQALQHLAADAAVLTEASRSSMLRAAWAVDRLSPEGAVLAARQAKAYAGRAARTVIEICTQCHGGVAVTWEHLMHLRLRRALFDDQLFGDQRVQLLAIAETRLASGDDEQIPLASGEGLDFGDTPDEAEFRSRLRTWLADNPAPTVGEGDDAEMDAQHVWHRMLADAGWVGLTFPVAYGGRGLSPTHEAILNDELGAAGAPPAPAINHITNAIRLFGTEEQKTEHLSGMLSCRLRWCQGFSEPNAGSDLASLTTRGERFTTADGTDAYRVNGQKIWTSEALWAQWCLLLLRTEADAPQHRGLSMLMVPMDTPGVEVTPIRTAYGSREFAAVFFDDVVVPAENLLGNPGQGWEIAMALLGFERGPADMGFTAKLGRLVSLVEAAIRAGELDVDPVQRHALAEAWVELEALRVHVQRSTSARLDGSAPGPEGSIDKLLMTRADQQISHALYDVLAARAVLQPERFWESYVWSRAQSIFGGTQQVQRNLVAQRVLGLPR